MLRRRETTDPFGASLLDMMTCALGAVILIFVLKLGVGKSTITDVERARDELKRQQTGLEAELSLNRKQYQDASEDVRRGGRGAIFGIPPIEGNMIWWGLDDQKEGDSRTFWQLSQDIASAFEQTATRLRGVSGLDELKRQINAGRQRTSGVVSLSEMLQVNLHFAASNPGQRLTCSAATPPHSKQVPWTEVAKAIDSAKAKHGDAIADELLTFHTILFIRNSDLANEQSLMQECINDATLADRFDGVFLAIPHDPR